MYQVDGDSEMVETVAPQARERNAMDDIINAYNEGFMPPILREIAEAYEGGTGEQFEVDIRPIMEEVNKVY